MTFLTAKLEQGLHSGQLITGEGLKSSSRDHAHTHNAARIASDHAGQQRSVSGCRKCSVCEGQDHHWDVFGDTDDDGEPVESCKHCDATRPLSERSE